MAIVRIDPAEWQNANVLQLDSNAPTNQAAMLEMDQWAYENGFARTNEYWLRRIRRDNQMIFRGICYRVEEEEHATQMATLQESETRAMRIEVALRGAEGASLR